MGPTGRGVSEQARAFLWALAAFLAVVAVELIRGA